MSRLDAVMIEVAGVLAGITELNVFDYPPEKLTPPAGYVSYPRSIDYDAAYGRGEDGMLDLPLTVVVGKVTTRAARDAVAAWASGDGPRSVKRAMEAHVWTSCDDVTVTSCEFDVEMIAGVPYLAAMFKATVVGQGED